MSELRIDAGPGFRVYCARRGPDVIILLACGDKGSRRRDIQAAEELLRELERR